MIHSFTTHPSVTPSGLKGALASRTHNANGIAQGAAAAVQQQRRRALPVHAAAAELDGVERAAIFGSSLLKAVQPSRLAQFRPAAAEAEVELEAEVEAGPAPTKVFGEPLPGDDEDVAALRQLLAQTQLEQKPLRLAYDALRDGWTPSAFHERVDGSGAALVVGLTEGGAIIGGYNPDGWDSQAVDKSNIAAFLFVWPDGDLTQRPIKLPKVGGPDEAVIRDSPDQGIWFGPGGLAMALTPGQERLAKSKLGAYYSRKPNEGRHLFTEGWAVKGGARGTNLTSLRVYVGA